MARRDEVNKKIRPPPPPSVKIVVLPPTTTSLHRNKKNPVSDVEDVILGFLFAARPKPRSGVGGRPERAAPSAPAAAQQS